LRVSLIWSLPQRFFLMWSGLRARAGIAESFDPYSDKIKQLF
jgi:hypothetical protein